MTFDLVRWGWPNTAAILALAALPFLALAMPTGPAPNAAVANPADEPAIIALADPDKISE
jgi:hypothetical protein